jgi:hypothetical protein
MVVVIEEYNLYRMSCSCDSVLPQSAWSAHWWSCGAARAASVRRKKCDSALWLVVVRDRVAGRVAGRYTGTGRWCAVRVCVELKPLRACSVCRAVCRVGRAMCV